MYRTNRQIVEALSDEGRGAQRAPRRASIRRAEDTDAEPRPPVSFASSAINNRWIRRVECDRTYRGGRLIIRAWRPGSASIETLPHATIRGSAKNVCGVSRIHGDGRNSPGYIDSNRTVICLAIGNGVGPERTPLRPRSRGWPRWWRQQFTCNVYQAGVFLRGGGLL